MLMLPATPHGTHSQAEKRVFDRLRAVFADEKNNSLVAYHSFNLTRHAYKRFGEIDFLICGPQGIFVLEIKGGRIACHNGVWEFTNRYNETSRKVEGPFKQAESALHGLMDKLKANLPERQISQFTIGYGVVVPDCELAITGAEWDPHVLADSHGFRDFERWLRKFFQYWRDKDGGNRQPDAESLKALRRYLRPEFEAIVPLHIQAGQAEERVARLTDDQMDMVDVVAANPRVLCSGGAGTGKTFLALELARRWTAEGMNVVLACRSPWLRRYLETKFGIPKLTVTLAESIGTACRRADLEFFDALIVDEGQDLFDMESLDQLDASLKNGLTGGRWCIFHDSNNQSGLCGIQEQDAIEYISSMQPTRVPLRTNCRNTRNILEKVQTMLRADMGVRGTGDGPRVREQFVPTAESSAEMLTKEIKEIVDQGGVAPGHITILSPLPFTQSSVSLLHESVKRNIVVLDEYSLRNFPPAKISFSEISSFKGLENEAIIVVDLETSVDGGPPQAQHYVAMSRARAILSLIFLARD
ncbi:MAG: AAA family ATPase [Desulfobulbaceae bacterium]|nr:AAA family ATPase [Desulfobulbaceae bacterium]